MNSDINLTIAPPADVCDRIPADDDRISDSEAKAELERVLASSDFPASSRNRRFLEFVVLRMLAGEQERISAYSVATQVFGRPETFNALVDPIVRIEAGKLRRALETYYLKSGRGNPLCISIPKGGYCPVFVRRPLPESVDAGGGDPPKADAAVPPDPRAELTRVLGSSDFEASERNRRFLQHVVERALSGTPVRIGAYEIATAVFGRPANFDPVKDPIVRIEAGKLRRALETYYLKSGRANQLRISIPKGGYAPVFGSAGGAA